MDYRVWVEIEIVIEHNPAEGDNSDAAIKQKVQDTIGHTGAIVTEFLQGEMA